MAPVAVFQLKADARAQAWLDSHPASAPRVIDWDVRQCCGGGKICTIRVRGHSDRDDPANYALAIQEDGTRFLVDRRAAARLPAYFGLTVRGLGPLKHLDLDLEPEQWGDLLYT
ncbi:MAG TPA: hypothetical protein VGU71_15575 [Candidatus Dormibacteraeota bacterium]|nr:hypothetical protein [Candidatus Dormibacteraeota bacterium]